MARITPKQLEQFKMIFLATFGEELDDAEALQQATQLIELISKVKHPVRNIHA